MSLIAYSVMDVCLLKGIFQGQIKILTQGTDFQQLNFRKRNWSLVGKAFLGASIYNNSPLGIREVNSRV